MECHPVCSTMSILAVGVVVDIHVRVISIVELNLGKVYCV